MMKHKNFDLKSYFCGIRFNVLVSLLDIYMVYMYIAYRYIYVMDVSTGKYTIHIYYNGIYRETTIQFRTYKQLKLYTGKKWLL